MSEKAEDFIKKKYPNRYDLAPAGWTTEKVAEIMEEYKNQFPSPQEVTDSEIAEHAKTQNFDYMLFLKGLSIGTLGMAALLYFTWLLSLAWTNPALGGILTVVTIILMVAVGYTISKK